jgi:hypothetical protein
MDSKCIALSLQENVLMWRARNCSIRELSLLLSFCVKYRPDILSEPQLAQTGITESRTILYKEVSNFCVLYEHQTIKLFNSYTL